MNKLYQKLLVAALLSASALHAESAGAQTSTQTFTQRIAAGLDDVEEAANGTIYTNSSDLELVDDPGQNGNGQTVGLRFTNVGIPAGAYVTRAYLQFTCDEQTSGVSNLLIKGQAVDNAPAFATMSFDVSGRTGTTASVSWAPGDWATVGQAGAGQATPDLRDVVQEIVGRTGWQSGNAVAFVITGTGRQNGGGLRGLGPRRPRNWWWNTSCPPFARPVCASAMERTMPRRPRLATLT